MSVERRVKPSERMRNEMASKRKPLYIALAMLLVVAAFIAVWFAGRNVGRGQKEPLDITATRTMLTAKVSYDGTWVAEPDGLFEVYLPGNMIANAEDYNSLGVSVDYTDESSGQVASGFGVVVTQQEFDIKIEDDPFFVLDRLLTILLRPGEREMRAEHMTWNFLRWTMVERLCDSQAM